jgi:hypothetical protein
VIVQLTTMDNDAVIVNHSSRLRLYAEDGRAVITEADRTGQ